MFDLEEAANNHIDIEHENQQQCPNCQTYDDNEKVLTAEIDEKQASLCKNATPNFYVDLS